MLDERTRALLCGKLSDDSLRSMLSVAACSHTSGVVGRGEQSGRPNWVKPCAGSQLDAPLETSGVETDVGGFSIEAWAGTMKVVTSSDVREGCSGSTGRFSVVTEAECLACENGMDWRELSSSTASVAGSLRLSTRSIALSTSCPERSTSQLAAPLSDRLAMLSADPALEGGLLPTNEHRLLAVAGACISLNFAGAVGSPGVAVGLSSGSDCEAPRFSVAVSWPISPFMTSDWACLSSSCSENSLSISVLSRYSPCLHQLKDSESAERRVGSALPCCRSLLAIPNCELSQGAKKTVARLQIEASQRVQERYRSSS
jgi:hypothetical protein